MPYKRTKAARLREFRRIGARIRAAEKNIATLQASRTALIVDDMRSDDPSTSEEIAAVSGVSSSAIRNVWKRNRELR